MISFERRAISHILFVLKLLFSVDGYREKETYWSERLNQQNSKAIAKNPRMETGGSSLSVQPAL